jgi:hypothetical protein
MSSSFKLTLAKDMDEVLSELRQFTKGYGGTFHGKAKAGTISVQLPLGKIGGSYAVEGRDLAITITDKPFVIPYETMRSWLQDKLREKGIVI